MNTPNIPDDGENLNPSSGTVVQSTKESIEQAQAFTILLGDVVTWCEGIYEGEQHYRDMQTSSQAALQLLDTIIIKAQELGLPLQNNSVKAYSIIELFQRFGYIFYPSPMQIEQNRWVLNLGIFKIGSIEKFDTVSVSISKLPKGKDQIDIHSIEKILIPDYRETERCRGKEKRMIFDGITIMDPISGKSKVMILEPNLEETRKKLGGTKEDARKRAILNEVLSVYFSQIIHNKFLSIPLSMFQLPMKGNIHSLSEALGDLGSLKYGRNFGGELKRILISTNLEYTVSREIMRKGIGFVLQKERIKVPPPGFNEEFLKRLSVHHPKKYKAFKDGIILYYEQVLVPLILHIRQMIDASEV